MKNSTMDILDHKGVPRALAGGEGVVIVSLRKRIDQIIALLVEEREKHDRAIAALSGSPGALGVHRRIR